MIVGQQSAGAPERVAAAWYAPGLTGWRPATAAGARDGPAAGR